MRFVADKVTNNSVQIEWKSDVSEPIIFMRQTEWPGIEVRHARVLPGQIREHVVPFHEVSIPIVGTLTTRRQTSTGRTVTKSCGQVGNICLTPAGQPIAASWNGELEHLAIHLDEHYLKRFAAENHFSPEFELTETYGRNDHLIRHIGLTLVNETKAESPSGKLFSESLTQTLIFHLLQNYSTARFASRDLQGGLSGYKLRQVKEHIVENLEADLSLAEIATVANLSQFHFSRAFRKTTGMTPQQFVMRQRIELAKELLAKNDLPIVEISLRTGFKNQSHFTTLFRKFTKLTPKTWRELKLA